jgi:hypothetical protein
VVQGEEGKNTTKRTLSSLLSSFLSFAVLVMERCRERIAGEQWSSSGGGGARGEIDFSIYFAQQPGEWGKNKGRCILTGTMARMPVVFIRAPLAMSIPP